MIVVLAIVGLMAALVVSHGPLHSQRLDLDAGARQVAASLRLARSRAIAQNRTVIWRAGATDFRIDNDPVQRLPVGVTVIDPGHVAFIPDGSASGARIVLQAAGRSVVVGVAWLTGHVAVAERK